MIVGRGEVVGSGESGGKTGEEGFTVDWIRTLLYVEVLPYLCCLQAKRELSDPGIVRRLKIENPVAGCIARRKLSVFDDEIRFSSMLNVKDEGTLAVSEVIACRALMKNRPREDQVKASGIAFGPAKTRILLRTFETAVDMPQAYDEACTIERENDLNQLGGRYISFSPNRQQQFICRIIGAPSDPVSAMREMLDLNFRGSFDLVRLYDEVRT
nr:catalase isozyme 3-like [Tanacetum cinerariifolium]